MDAAHIIDRLVEDEIGSIDAKAEFMRLRPEIRLLDRADKKDVVLLDDHGPLYIGTVGPKGNWWRIAWLAPKSSGRVQRVELAKYYPNAEQAAEHLVNVMQPWWQTVLYRRAQDAYLTTESEEVDPKDYVMRAMTLRSLKDLQRQPNDQQYICNDPHLIAHYKTGGPFQCWQPIWQGGGVVSIEFADMRAGSQCAATTATQLRYLQPSDMRIQSQAERDEEEARFRGESEETPEEFIDRNAEFIRIGTENDVCRALEAAGFTHPFVSKHHQKPRYVASFSLNGVPLERAREINAKGKELAINALRSALPDAQNIVYNETSEFPGSVDYTLSFSSRRFNYVKEEEEEDPEALIDRVMTMRSVEDLQRQPKRQVYLCHDPKLSRVYGGPVRCWRPVWQGDGMVKILFDSGNPSNFVSTAVVQLQHLTPYLDKSPDGPVTESWSGEEDPEAFIERHLPELKATPSHLILAMKALGFVHANVGEYGESEPNLYLLGYDSPLDSGVFNDSGDNRDTVRKELARGIKAGRSVVRKLVPDATEVSVYTATTDDDFIVYFRSKMFSYPSGRPRFVVAEAVGDDKATIDQEAAKAEKPKSPEQAEAGNYAKGHVSFQGIPIAIENAKGSTRSGTNKKGEKWSVTMPAHYGYVKGSESKDGDAVDVYIGETPSSMLVYVVNQKKEDSGAFDEHKCMLGFKSKDEAIAAYDAAFTGDLGPKLRGPADDVISCTVDQFKDWLKHGKTEKPFKLEESEEVDPTDFIERNADAVHYTYLCQGCGAAKSFPFTDKNGRQRTIYYTDCDNCRDNTYFELEDEELVNRIRAERQAEEVTMSPEQRLERARATMARRQQNESAVVIARTLLDDE